MNFTAKLPCGKTKDVWIAGLPKGTHFCTRRPMICANCGKNDLEHISAYGLLICKSNQKEGAFAFGIPTNRAKIWQPLPPKFKTGKRYAICSGRGTKAICECGRKEHEHHRRVGIAGYKPLSCELVSVLSEEEWLPSIFKKGKEMPELIGGRYIGIDLAKADYLDEEAKMEGFETWQQLQDWITNHYGGYPKMWRYEFVR